MCGDAAVADKLAAKTLKLFPDGTICTAVQLPEIRAAINRIGALEAAGIEPYIIAANCAYNSNVLYSTYVRMNREAYGECNTTIVAGLSLTTILAQSQAKNVVSSHHEIVWTNVI